MVFMVNFYENDKAQKSVLLVLKWSLESCLVLYTNAHSWRLCALPTCRRTENKQTNLLITSLDVKNNKDNGNCFLS